MNNCADFLENADIISIVIDNTDTIIIANTYAIKILGEKIIGLPFKEIFIDFTISENEILELKKGTKRKLLNVNTKNQTPLTYLFSSYASKETVIIYGEPDNVHYNQMHLTLAKLNNKLSNMTRQLTKQNIQLEQINKLKNQFIGMTAHDLRNPIGNILMYSEFVLENQGSFANEELKQVVNVIRESSEYMISIIDDLLNVVKLDTVKIELRQNEIDMNELIKQILDIYLVIAEKKGIKISYLRLNKISNINVDAVKIKEVINNILSNAIKYSYPNTTITLSCFEAESDFIVSVNNFGPIIPHDKIPHIFTPFAHIGIKPTGDEKSHGLGLSIVKQIIIAHEGKIWVESKEDNGTTFSFTIPFHKNHKI